MSKLLATFLLMLLLAPSAYAAAPGAPVQPSTAPVQVQPSGGAASPLQGTGSIPLTSGTPEEDQAAKKDREAKAYLALVLFGALAPILAIVLIRFWPRTADFRRSKRSHYYSGPADPRRMSRRNKR